MMSSTSKSNKEIAKKLKLSPNPKNQREVEQQTRNWLELPSDIMTDILFRIGVKDMLRKPLNMTFKHAVDKSQGQLIDLTMVNFD
ncbi:hypothetical protein Tco_1452544, partial [Tanacetum coccineum]